MWLNPIPIDARVRIGPQELLAHFPQAGIARVTQGR